jgi:hypothetical protein
VVFAFAQVEPPYAVTPVTLDGAMREIGAGRWHRAMQAWGKCLAKGTDREHWPPYVDGPIQVTAPAWALAQELSEQ